MVAPLMLSTEEQLIIQAFARNLQGGGSGTLTLAHLTALSDQRDGLWKALWSLCDRGWLAINSQSPWQDHDECVLVGEGLREATKKQA